MAHPQLPPARIVHLSNYLRELVSDIAAQGKIAKIEGNAVQVASVALLSGSIAIVEAMASDIKLLAGNAKDQAKLVGRPMLERVAGDVAARGASMLFAKLFGR